MSLFYDPNSMINVFNSVPSMRGKFKAYAVGYMSGLPQDEFLHSVNFNIFHLAELNELLEDEELKDILPKIRVLSYINNSLFWHVAKKSCCIAQKYGVYFKTMISSKSSFY